jgi:hypothetical protein
VSALLSPSALSNGEISSRPICTFFSRDRAPNWIDDEKGKLMADEFKLEKDITYIIDSVMGLKLMSASSLLSYWWVAD